MSDYSNRWSSFRFWNRLGGTLLVSYPLAFIAVILVPVNETAVPATMFAGFAALVICGWKLKAFRCPRCERPFLDRSIFSVGIACAHCGLKRYAQSETDSMPLHVSGLPEAFQRRRALWLKITKPLFVIAWLFFLTFLGLLASGQKRFVHLAFWPFIGFLFACGAVTFWVYRCPRCNRMPVGRRRGIPVDPEYCLHCGARFHRDASTN